MSQRQSGRVRKISPSTKIRPANCSARTEVPYRPSFPVPYYYYYYYYSVFVGPCHHGTARPQVADGGTASDMEGSFEQIE